MDSSRHIPFRNLRGFAAPAPADTAAEMVGVPILMGGGAAAVSGVLLQKKDQPMIVGMVGMVGMVRGAFGALRLDTFKARIEYPGALAT